MIAAVLLCVLLCGCAAEKQKTCYYMNTVMDLQVWGNDADEAIYRIEQLLEDLEHKWSVTKSDSVTSRLNAGENVALSDEEIAFLAEVQTLSERTDGAFDPKLHALSNVWGFYFGQNQADDFVLPTDEQIAAALTEEKWDFGAAVKGYAGRQAVSILEDLRVQRAVLNLGGNIQTYGEKADGTPWQIGIQDPNGGDYLGVLSVSGTMAVVTSGDYQRYFEVDGNRYHHILDPQTGYPADSRLRSVTVVCADGVTADALSTALFVMGLEQSAEFWRNSSDFEAVFVTDTGEIYATESATLSGCTFEVISSEK